MISTYKGTFIIISVMTDRIIHCTNDIVSLLQFLFEFNITLDSIIIYEYNYKEGKYNQWLTT